MNPGFLMVYSLKFLGNGPHFDELARYFSFEQIIHYAFDGFYSIKYGETRDQWFEIIECNAREILEADYNRPKNINVTALCEYIQSQFNMYVAWLSRYVTLPNESSFACVENVWFEGDDVYIRGYDYAREFRGPNHVPNS